jgi:hypothetical protein
MHTRQIQFSVDVWTRQLVAMCFPTHLRPNLIYLSCLVTFAHLTNVGSRVIGLRCSYMPNRAVSMAATEAMPTLDAMPVDQRLCVWPCSSFDSAG